MTPFELGYSHMFMKLGVGGAGMPHEEYLQAMQEAHPIGKPMVAPAAAGAKAGSGAWGLKGMGQGVSQGWKGMSGKGKAALIGGGALAAGGLFGLGRASKSSQPQQGSTYMMR